MKHLKKFESYATQAEPSRSPNVAPAKPKTSPGTRPSRPNPIRRHKPAVDPKPKAELDDVINLLDLVSSEEDKKRIEDYYAKKDN